MTRRKSPPQRRTLARGAIDGPETGFYPSTRQKLNAAARKALRTKRHRDASLRRRELAELRGQIEAVVEILRGQSEINGGTSRVLANLSDSVAVLRERAIREALVEAVWPAKREGRT